MNSFLLIAGGECHGQKACLKNDNSHQIPARVVLICPHCNTPCRPSIHQGQYILPIEKIKCTAIWHKGLLSLRHKS